MIALLYVDDDENDVLLTRTAFARAGITNDLYEATDGQMAIDYLAGVGQFNDRAKYPLPGLLLLDLKVPRKPGLEVLDWVRRHPMLKAMIVIVLSSSPDTRDVRRAYELGANSFITKPSNLTELTEMARTLKAWWLDHNQFVPMNPIDDSGVGTSLHAA
jgi:CheY-like chemotaxis protein